MSRRRFLWLLVALTAFAFVVRIAVAAHFQGLAEPPDAASNPDQIDYERFGWHLANGQGYTLASGVPTARRPPGTSFALLVPYLLAGHSFAAARIWFCLLSAATCALTGLIAAELFGLATGLVAAAALALDPAHFYYSMHFLSEVPYGFAITITVLLAARWLRGAPSWRLAAGAGLAFGFALLTRPQVFFAGPLALLAFACARPLRQGVRVRQVALATALAAAVVVPWLVRNDAAVGRMTISTIGGFTFWGANNAVIAAQPRAIGSWMPVDTLIDRNHRLDGTEVENDRAAWRYGLDYLRSHPGDVPRLLMMKVVRHFSAFPRTDNQAVRWSLALAWLATAPLLLAGGVLALRRRVGAVLLVLLPCVSTLLTALVFYGSIRFRDADVALFVIPAAAAFTALLSRRRGPGIGAAAAPPAT
jgi:4-amino-4-deoxy-L-arabinose transferase-like glycosyltransferase